MRPVKASVAARQGKQDVAVGLKPSSSFYSHYNHHIKKDHEWTSNETYY